MASALQLPASLQLERGVVIAVGVANGETVSGVFSGFDPANAALVLARDDASVARIPFTQVDQIAVEHESVTTQYVLTATLVSLGIGGLMASAVGVAALADDSYSGESAIHVISILRGAAATLSPAIAAVAAAEPTEVVYRS